MHSASGLERAIDRAALAAALALWLASLALPAVAVRGGPELSGLDMLLRGWEGWRSGVFAWFANPLLLLAVAAGLLRKERLASAVALAGALLAITSFWAADVARAGGTAVPELSFRSGFYCWLTAHLLVLSWGIFGSLRSGFRGRRRGAEQPGYRD